jgi:hypothetical protein
LTTTTIAMRLNAASTFLEPCLTMLLQQQHDQKEVVKNVI